MDVGQNRAVSAGHVVLFCQFRIRPLRSEFLPALRLYKGLKMTAEQFRILIDHVMKAIRDTEQQIGCNVYVTVATGVAYDGKSYILIDDDEADCERIAEEIRRMKRD